MPHALPGALNPLIFFVEYPPGDGGPFPPGGPLAQISVSKQGFGMRILLDIEFGATGTVRVAWEEVTPPSSSNTYYAGLRSISDFENFSDWNQIPDLTIELDSRKVLFDGAMRSLTDIQVNYGFEDRIVRPRFWVDGQDVSSALTIGLFIVKAPIQYDETKVRLRAVGVQRALPDRLGDLALKADLSNILPADEGKIFPLVFGSAKRVRGIEAKTSRVTLLEGFIDDNDTTITAADLSGWPTSGSIKIDDEIISYAGITGTDFTGCTRAQSSTAAASHFTGANIIEQANTIYVFSGLRAKSIDTVYAPDGQQVTGGSVTVANTALIAGKTLATVEYTTPPEIDVIEGGTSTIDFDLETGAGGSAIDEDDAHKLEAAYSSSNYARLVGATNKLISQFPAGAVEDLGEIVKIALGVRHFGFGTNLINVAARVQGQADLGNLAKGTFAIDPVSAALDGSASVSGQAQVNTDIAHTHREEVAAYATATNPDDASDDCAGWITARTVTCGPPGPNVIPPTLKANCLSADGTIAVYKRSGADDTLKLTWDTPGTVYDTSAGIRKVRLILVHGNPLENADGKVRLYIKGTLIIGSGLQGTITSATSRTTIDIGWIDVSSYGWTINDLHDTTNSRIEIVGKGSSNGDTLVVYVAYLLLELWNGINPIESSNKAGSGSSAGAGPLSGGLSGVAAEWNEVEEFFEIPTAQIADWDNLPSKLFEIEGTPTPGSEVWIREVFIRVEYRRRRKQKPEYLSADMQGVDDQGHSQADGFYTGGSATTLIENPIDLLEYVLVELMGVPTGRIDFTYNDTQRTAYVTESHLMGGALIESMGSVKFIQRYLLEARARFFLELDKLRIKRIELDEGASSFTFDSSNIILDGTSRPVIEITPDEKIINRVALYYARDFMKPAKSADYIVPQIDDFELVTDKQDSGSITTHQERRREYWSNFLNEDRGTIAGNIAQLMVDKYLDTRIKISFEATWASLAVATDDVVEFTWPTLGFSATKCRVVKEVFSVGDPVTGAAPRKRYELLVLFATEYS